MTNILDIMFNEEADRKKRLEKQETLREVFFLLTWLSLDEFERARNEE